MYINKASHTFIAYSFFLSLSLSFIHFELLKRREIIVISIIAKKIRNLQCLSAESISTHNFKKSIIKKIKIKISRLKKNPFLIIKKNYTHVYKLGTKCVLVVFWSTGGRYPCWAVLYFSKKEPMGKGMNPFFKASMCRYMHVCTYACMCVCMCACM